MFAGTLTLTRTLRRDARAGAFTAWDDAPRDLSGSIELLVTFPCQTRDYRASSNWESDHGWGNISPVDSSTHSDDASHAARVIPAS